jgi:hypothetical protein
MRKAHGVEPVLIVIDTVAAAAAFQKEDDAAQAQAVMNAMGRLSAVSGALVLGVDHFGKDETTGTRGSSAKEAACETVLALVGKREITGKITDLRLGVRKVRDGDQGRVIPFRLEVVNCGTDEDGDQITTCVVHWEPNRTQGHGGGRNHWARNKGMVALHQALTIAIAEHGSEFQPRDYVEPVRAVALERIRKQFKHTYPPPVEEDPRRRGKTIWAAFKRSVEAAQACDLILTEATDETVFVWEPSRDDEPM